MGWSGYAPIDKATLINQILFLTLKVFSATGGIEKVCRVAGKAMYEYGLQNNAPVSIFSMHDKPHNADNNKYFPAEIFWGFGAARVKFIQEAVAAGRKSRVVIISHINLLVAGWLIKKISPSTKVILMAHGIEIWKPLSRHKQLMLEACDKVVSVSSFTCKKIMQMHRIPAEKCTVLNNCIDPFMNGTSGKEHSPALREKYGFTEADTILLTLTRLSAIDRYKGYEYVLQALAKLTEENKNLKYLLAGSYDAAEKQFIDAMIERLGLRGHAVLTGFVPEEELAAHFSLADIYVMPSVKEGFGIVFVEAMFYGVPVIAGNADGSADALLTGELGLLIEPENPAAIADAIQKILADKKKYIPEHKLLMEHFSYEAYKRKLGIVLDECSQPEALRLSA